MTCLSAAQPAASTSYGPRSTRYETSGDSEVVIERHHDRVPRDSSGTLLDLSALGAKLATDCALSIEENVTLYFQFSEPGLNFTVEAQVRWTRPAKESLWWVGCSFSPSLPEEYLENLAGKGLIDRRREVRRRVHLAAKARLELESSEPLPITINDISSGGVRLTAPHGTAPGKRVLIEAQGAGGRTLLIPTRCQWQVGNADQFVLGCSFLDATGFVRLNEALTANASLPAAQPASKRRGWFWPWG